MWCNKKHYFFHGLRKKFKQIIEDYRREFIINLGFKRYTNDRVFMQSYDEYICGYPVQVNMLVNCLLSSSFFEMIIILRI